VARRRTGQQAGKWSSYHEQAKGGSGAKTEAAFLGHLTNKKEVPMHLHGTPAERSRKHIFVARISMLTPMITTR